MFPPPGQGHVICAIGELVQDIVIEDIGPLASLDNQGSDTKFVLETPTRCGGAAVNALLAVASLRAPARFLGHYGEDAVSSVFADELQRKGVRVFGVRRGKGARSVCVRKADGEYLFIFDPGSSNQIRPSDIRSWWLKDAAVLHVSGHALDGPAKREAFWSLVDLAHSAEVPISFDIGIEARVADVGAEALREDIARMKPAVLMCNETEGNLLGIHEQYPEGAAVVIQHHAANPTEVFMATGDQWSVDVPQVEATEILDTMGAGEAFAGGFLTGWVGGRSLRDCVDLGHQVATEGIKYSGSVIAPETTPMVVA